MVALKLSQAKASGCPVVVIPAGTDRNGVPFGAQLIGPRWRDERLLAIAEAITAATSGFQPPPGADTKTRAQRRHGHGHVRVYRMLATTWTGKTRWACHAR